MREKIQHFSNFTRAMYVDAPGVRPDNEWQLEELFSHEMPYLARGNGLSYSDSCLLDKGLMIDTTRLNHFLEFDSKTGGVVCQGGVTMADLFSVSAHHIPAILPGTLHATLAGAVAHDIHGKNNHHYGSFGHQVQWLDLQIKDKVIRCSSEEYSDLFYATVGGLGLTGIIRRLGINLLQAPPVVSQTILSIPSMDSLIQTMQTEGVKSDYQVAWLDLFKAPRALLSLANRVDNQHMAMPSCFESKFVCPKIPFSLVNRWTVKTFNRLYYLSSQGASRTLSLWDYNNPLDKIQSWNRVYGPHGLIQFQAVFDRQNAVIILTKCIEIIRSSRAIPTLAVLKYFSVPGKGMLSFPTQGFTLAVDFLNKPAGHGVIKLLNQYMAEVGGRVYLAKDLFLTPEQFRIMYPNHPQFMAVLKAYKCPLQSHLSRRLGLTG